MVSTRSVPRHGVVRAVAVALVLAAACLAVHGSAKGVTASSVKPPLSVSLEQSSSAVPLGGTMGFTGVIRFSGPASSVQARIQVHRPNGRLVYLRTQYVNSLDAGTNKFSFSRPLSGLGLDAGEYPATFSVQALVGGSYITTDVSAPLRIYDPSKPPVSVVIVAKVHSVPMTAPDGRFALDPATDTLPRDQVARIAELVLSDPLARITLAVAPSALEEWRRIASSGYTLETGTAVPPTDATPRAYANALQQLQTAVATTRLELVSLGYTDPSLADLSAHKLDPDAAVQYDAGISACFASLQATPSPSTAPAGGCIPQPMQSAVATRGVRVVIADSGVTRVGKQLASTGVYPVASSPLRALVVDALAGRALESGDASPTLERTFERAGGPTASQPFAVRIDLNDSVRDATATVGTALAAVEGSPWTQLALARDVRVPKRAKPVRFTPVQTKNAPARFWTTVHAARADATGLLAALSASDDLATSAQTNSLFAESSAWADPSATWAGAPRGLEFAQSAQKSARSIFSKVHVVAEPITLAGSTGDVPVNVQNTSSKTLSVVLACRGTNGVRLTEGEFIPTTLSPGETFVSVPIDMGSMLSGRLTVRVMAGSVVIARQSVVVRHSYLDRIALVGGIVVTLAGMLIWIVLRVRRAQVTDESDQSADYSDQSAESDAEGTHERYTGVGHDPSSGNDLR